MKTCSSCKKEKPLELFAIDKRKCEGRDSRCKECKRRTNTKSQQRIKNCPARYIRHKYTTMKRRVSGGNKDKAHLYLNLPICERQEFIDWSLKHEDFIEVFNNWVKSNHSYELIPSIDRIDSRFGYELWNMEWTTQQENSRRGALSKHYGRIF